MPSEPWTCPGIERIVLVGFMAAGKSTVARLLARRLQWEALDLDDLIRDRTGRSPGRIIREDGEEEFRRLETAVTADLASSVGAVVATGGGWATDPARALLLGPNTFRVWLRVTAAEAIRRAEAEGTDRPLLGAPDDARAGRVKGLLAEREPAYAAAEIVVDVDGKEPPVVVDEIVRRLEDYSGG